ncbi:phosphoenolpyruvate synthase [Nitzschia inconspicua]|uniref:Phosphoenolpyruvate synthase n=1 Tax=Nitzschia inconspicua TaxID=303405 RepID=A0A9K3PT88_9STRA|nr:phosphoenolpyruvate synthase [Nitzschia inconspicua]
MKIFVVAAFLGSPSACFGFVAPLTTSTYYKEVTAPILPLRVVSDLKKSTISKHDDTPSRTVPFTISFDEICLEDIPKVGGKTASLGEMIQRLQPLGVDVPGGFGVTSSAYDAVLDQLHLREQLGVKLESLDVSNLERLAEVGRECRKMIMEVGLPEDVRNAIESAYTEMCTDGSQCSVAVRSSATAEDLPNASFAGQQASFLNIIGPSAVADAVLECFASIFTDRAITYRAHNNFDHLKVKGAVAVQLMVRSDLASAGVAFTLDPDTGFRDVCVITGSYGLGESVVGGKVDPEEVQVFKPMIGKVEDPIISRRIGRKQTSIIYTDGDSKERTKTIMTAEEDQARRSFSDEDTKQLAQWCVEIERHYSLLHGHPTPMDIEWAKDGITGQLYIVQARPETVRARQEANAFRQTTVKQIAKDSIIDGTAIGSDAATGTACVIESLSDISKMSKGEILVADITNPDWVPAIRMASAVVTNRGGRTCHAAIVSRELGVPCIVGAKGATELLKNGIKYTVDCSRGATGRIYEGEASIEKNVISINDLPQTKTKIQLILADPETAFLHSSLPVAGVGLVRQEFVTANAIGIHPNAVLFPERLDEDERRLIEEKAKNDNSPKAFFVRRLSEGIGSIAAAFYPRPITVRLGDFKSNEYRRLIGGEHFEPEEENPMIGLRGASRYLHPDYVDAFNLECEALLHVRDRMGLDNVQLMVPFCRTTEEANGVVNALAKNGLKRGKDGLKVWCMCELPSNVFAIDSFASFFDGFSIGSNDLTQLVLGIDRDSGELAHLFDEENEAVKTAIREAIQGSKRNGKLVGLCGQAPSDKPDFAEFLVSEGIDSISLTPDAVITAIDIVAKAEKKACA